MNTNTFKSVFDYLALTKKSNTINSWLLGVNSAILLLVINSFIKPSEVFKRLLNHNLCFKSLCLILFIWLSLNISLLMIYIYKEKVMSLIIEDKYFRLKSFISYMDNIKDITKEELLEVDVLRLDELTNTDSKKNVLKEYSVKIIDYHISLVKWSNNRLLIYRFVIFVSVPLLLSYSIIVLSYFDF